MTMLPPGQGGGLPPKHLMQMLSTLMLNKRLQQGQGQPTAPPNPMGMQMPQAGGENRMAQLARMQLEMGGGPRPPMM